MAFYYGVHYGFIALCDDHCQSFPECDNESGWCKLAKGSLPTSCYKLNVEHVLDFVMFFLVNKWRCTCAKWSVYLKMFVALFECWLTVKIKTYLHCMNIHHKWYVKVFLACQWLYLCHSFLLLYIFVSCGLCRMCPGQVQDGSLLIGETCIPVSCDRDAVAMVPNVLFYDNDLVSIPVSICKTHSITLFLCTNS